MGSMTSMRHGFLAIVRAGLLVSAVSPLSIVGAQPLNRTIDEGTFLISRGGAPAGRESFRISRFQSATAEVYRATALVAFGDRRIVPTLTCDSMGSPVAYDVAIQGGAEEGVRLQARARPGRFSSMLRTSEGESTREYVMPTGVVVLDDDVIHQLYFVTVGGRRSGSLTILAPRTGNQAVARLEDLGASTVDIGGKYIPATHFVLSAAGFPRREFWIDAAGRVLKATIPDRGLVAQRDEPPR
jgi:hypothetical protein